MDSKYTNNLNTPIYNKNVIKKVYCNTVTEDRDYIYMKIQYSHSKQSGQHKSRK